MKKVSFYDGRRSLSIYSADFLWQTDKKILYILD